MPTSFIKLVKVILTYQPVIQQMLEVTAALKKEIYD